MPSKPAIRNNSWVGDPGYNRENRSGNPAATGNSGADCPICNGTGFKDYAGFCMDPCDHPMAPRLGKWMQTYTGKQFWPMDPRPEEICIEDIAHALAHQCRYAGHCREFYSVAEHSAIIASWLDHHYGPKVAFAGLMHDAPEAYLVDVPRPVKPFLLGYNEAEEHLWLAIAGRFGLPNELPPEVLMADNRILNDERDQNMSEPPVPWEGDSEPLGVDLAFADPKEAEEIFLGAFHDLSRRRDA